MQNTNENKQPEQNSVSTNTENAASKMADTATEQAKKVADESKEQLGKIGGEVQNQMKNAGQAGVEGVKNLGQAGAQQVQNLGQEGMKQVGGIMTAFTQPLSPEFKQQQPPVTKDEKIYGTVAYIPFVALLSIIIKPDSAYVRLHARQGLLLSLLFFFGGMFAAIVSLFGVIGSLLAFLIGLIPFACMIIGLYSMYLALTGIWWKIPVLGSIAEIIPVEWMAKTSKENITGQAGVAKVDYDNRSDVIKQEKQENQPQSPAQTTQQTQQTATTEQKTDNNQVSGTTK